jgi:NADH:ubiquinone reductase (non-electrogenic)
MLQPLLLALQGVYYEALCNDVDPVKKELVCCFPKDAGFPEACFKLSYDILIVAVRAVRHVMPLSAGQRTFV